LVLRKVLIEKSHLFVKRVFFVSLGSWHFFFGPRGFVYWRYEVFQQVNTLRFLEVLKRFFSFFSGIVFGFISDLRLVGVGYRIWLFLNNIFFKAGFCVLLALAVPLRILVRARRQRLVLFGLLKSDLSYYLSILLTFIRVNPYVGKGLRVAFTKVDLKKGKVRLK